MEPWEIKVEGETNLYKCFVRVEKLYLSEVRDESFNQHCGRGAWAFQLRRKRTVILK